MFALCRASCVWTRKIKLSCAARVDLLRVKVSSILHCMKDSQLTVLLIVLYVPIKAVSSPCAPCSACAASDAMAEHVASWLKMSGANVGAGGVRRCADSCLRRDKMRGCVSVQMLTIIWILLRLTTADSPLVEVRQ